MDVAKPWQGSPSTALKPKKTFMPRLVRSNRPDHTIGGSGVLQGRFEFTGLLRVDGRFEGVLKPAAGSSLVVARSGVVVGDVEGCDSVVVEGTVVGNISGSTVNLRRHAYIVGNVWCKDLVAAPTAVFRNRGSSTSAPMSSVSSSSAHRRSVTALSDLVGVGVDGVGKGSGMSGSRNASLGGGSVAASIVTQAISSSSSSSNSNSSSSHGKSNTNSGSTSSPDSSGHRASATATAAASSKKTSSGTHPEGCGLRTVTTSASYDLASTAEGRLPRQEMMSAVDDSAAFPGNGGFGEGVGGVEGGRGCSFSTGVDSIAAFGGKASVCEESPSVTLAAQPPPSAGCPSSSRLPGDGRGAAVATATTSTTAPVGSRSRSIVSTESGLSAGADLHHHQHLNRAPNRTEDADAPVALTSLDEGSAKKRGTGKTMSAGPPPPPPPPPETRSFPPHGEFGRECSSSRGDSYSYAKAPRGSSPRSQQRCGHVMGTEWRASAGSARDTGGSGSSGSGRMGETSGGGGPMKGIGNRGGCPFSEHVHRSGERGLRRVLPDNPPPDDHGGSSASAGSGARARAQADGDRAAGGSETPLPSVGDKDGANKTYGVKATSLTQKFSAVAMLLSFDGQVGFEEHLQMEYAAENLWFWKQGMTYRSTTFKGADQRLNEARRIYDAFLSVDSPDQVNISHEDRESVLAAVEGAPGARAVGAGLFDDALIQVENMLAMGPFPRFAGNTVKNIESSWKKIVQGFGVEDTGESFYSIMFEMAPSVETLFTRSKRVQGEMLMGIVDSSVKLLNNLQELVPALIELGLRHNAYKVRREHYPVVGDALIATLSMVLQEDFTEEIKQSWLVVYSLMANIMLSVLEPPEDDEALGGSVVETSSVSSDSCTSDSGFTSTSQSLGIPAASDVVLPFPVVGASRANSVVQEEMMPQPANHRAGRSLGGGDDRPLRSIVLKSGTVTGGGGGGGGSGGGVRGIYRRGTISFRNHISKLVRKESSNGHVLPSSSSWSSSPSFPVEPASTAPGTAASGSPADSFGGSASSSFAGSSTAADPVMAVEAPGVTAAAAAAAAAVAGAPAGAAAPRHGGGGL